MRVLISEHGCQNVIGLEMVFSGNLLRHTRLGMHTLHPFIEKIRRMILHKISKSNFEKIENQFFKTRFMLL